MNTVFLLYITMGGKKPRPWNSQTERSFLSNTYPNYHKNQLRRVHTVPTFLSFTSCRCNIQNFIPNTNLLFFSSNISSMQLQESLALQLLTNRSMKLISPNHTKAKDSKHSAQTHHSSCKWYFPGLTARNGKTAPSHISKAYLYITSPTKLLATSSAALCIHCFLENLCSSVLWILNYLPA